MTLDIDLNHKLNLDLQRDIVGRRIAVLGVSGQGKTNTAAVLVEELLSAGLPLTIVDIEGEYWGLKEQYQILVVGSGEHTDFPATPDQAGALAELSVAEGISMILDLSDFTATVQTDFLLAYFTALWAAANKKRTPYEVIIEEAHEFVPEGVRTPLKDLLNMVALRGRKRGLGAIIMSQRSASVAKSFLTQAEMLFLHRVVHPTDLRVYKDLIPLPAKEVEEMVGRLEPGQVVFVYNHKAELVSVRLRHTFHAGATPQLDAVVAEKLKHIDAKVLDKLAQAVAGGGEKSTGDDNQDRQGQSKRVKELEAEFARLKAVLNDRDNEIYILRESIRLRTGVMLSEASPVVTYDTTAAEADSVTRKRENGSNLREFNQVISELPQDRQEVIRAGTEQLRRELNEYDRRRLTFFQRKLGQLTDRELSLLEFMMESDGKWFTRQDLFKYTGIHMGHFTRDFKILLELPFVETNGMQMRSALTDWAKFVSPGVEPKTIFKFVKTTFS